jgi:quercetin dioxygenase-like cupin family protein
MGRLRQREAERHEVAGTVWEGASAAQRRVEDLAMLGVWHGSAFFPAVARYRVYSEQVSPSRRSPAKARPVRRVGAVAAALALAATLSACGGGDDEAVPAEGDAAGVEVVAPEGAAILLDAQALNALDQRIVYPKKVKKAEISSEIEVLEPGQETGWRKYKVPVYVYVLEGALSVEYDAGVVKDYAAGTAFVQAQGIWHNISNKGDVRTRMLTVTMGVKGVKSRAER